MAKPKFQQNIMTPKKEPKSPKERIISIIIRLVVVLALAFAITRVGAFRNSNQASSSNQSASTQTESSQSQTKVTTGDTSLTSGKGTTKSGTIYTFRNEYLRKEHFEKHGSDFDYANAKEYEAGACDVINNSKALHKKEADDGDEVYYLKKTNEFVILSTDGYIRTYFKPDDGIDYYNRQ